MRVIFFLLILLIVSSCYKSKSDLEGLWQFHSYISEEGKNALFACPILTKAACIPGITFSTTPL